MELDANDLLLFARVAEAGSFSAAAERAGLPKSTLSRRIAALENRLGERLFTRSTRRLQITDFGTGILEHARRLLEETEAVQALAQYRQAAPRGRLRVSMPPDFAEWLLAPLFLQFAASYPELRLELDLSSRRVDIIGEQFDLALRVTTRLPDDATLVARRLFDLHSGLYASPAYLQRFGTPTRPEELLQHTALGLIGSSGEAQRWQLGKAGAHWEGLPAGPLAANSVNLLRLLVCHGLGIAGLAERFVADSVAQGLLVRVLPEWRLPSVTVWAVMPGRRLMPARTKVFLDALQGWLAR
ncbi:MAG: LysR family transcriptional regulator [Candidatus Dactylopiibacterium carminicum]|uniref:LysR family transcriptional regulator n=1 Tax=Candidatus Dactylopiibacterium carminicum TaxID=857335 RepID=A0A272EYH0_9RHOO|nr:LysR family transcriptional regulator [Candidatus Dactylopiibacterium carminicum]KAF7600586.1 LysR family transcriptional regulator [Candidatus Dactylopiibacterium carminicum]PAS95178.1 MAG: LysR family transcriptional regulator [Candidatus Dactylopiibacterium carminicum]PAS97979.1 MAG: LysR family transcriptional regulator [Candidatus Dactylopiibacterium carminicum]PAT00591.1 MAG: LysR family transcriptional regulator [Candidatus Dactylopiibacterium carminicum]